MTECHCLLDTLLSSWRNPVSGEGGTCPTQLYETSEGHLTCPPAESLLKTSSSEPSIDYWLSVSRNRYIILGRLCAVDPDIWFQSQHPNQTSGSTSSSISVLVPFGGRGGLRTHRGLTFIGSAAPEQQHQQREEGTRQRAGRGPARAPPTLHPP